MSSRAVVDRPPPPGDTHARTRTHAPAPLPCPGYISGTCVSWCAVCLQITIQSNNIGDGGITTLAGALNSATSGVTLLHAMRNDIGAGGAAALGQMLARDGGLLEELALSGNPRPGRVCRHAACMRCVVLTISLAAVVGALGHRRRRHAQNRCFLAHARLGTEDGAVQHLAQGLSANRALRVLRLARCQLGDTGVTEFASGLEAHARGWVWVAQDQPRGVRGRLDCPA